MNVHIVKFIHFPIRWWQCCTNSRPSAEPTHHGKLLEKSSQFLGFVYFICNFPSLPLPYSSCTPPQHEPESNRLPIHTHTQRHNAGIQYSSGGCRVYIQTLVHMNFIITIYTWFLFADNEENCEFSNVMKINCDMTLYLQFFICLSEWTFNRLISGCSFVPQRVGAVGGIGQRNAHLR